MKGATLIMILAGCMLAIGLLTVLAWLIYTTYLNRVERRLAQRKGLYRELVAELATRDRALLEPTINQMSTLYDLDALEAVLEEQARASTGRPGWLLEVYDQLGLVDKYIEKLRSARKWRDRAFAAELLGRVGSAKAVPALLETVQATHTEDADVREIALRALARIADPRAVEPLTGALANAEGWLAPRIADILARHGELVIEPLITLLTQSDRKPARAWAANVLGEVGAHQAFPLLIQVLDDPDDEVRAKAATALGRLGDRRAVSSLLDHLLTDRAPFVRARIAATLGQFGGPEVVDRLVRALGDPAWWVRMRAVEALEQIGPLAEGPLLVALDDADPEIRARAAVALERLGVPARLAQKIERGEQFAEASQALEKFAAAGTHELLAELLGSPSPHIRRIAVTASRKAGRQDLAAELIHLAGKDSDSELRASTFETLASLRVKPAVAAAISSLEDPDHKVRTAAIHVIGELGGSEAVDLLRSQTLEPDPAVRAAVARELGALGARRAQDDLLRLLRDPEPTVREAVVTATAEARLQSLLPAVIELLDDSDEKVRAATARALGALGDRTTAPALIQALERATPELQDVILIAVGRLDSTLIRGLLDYLVEGGHTGGKLAAASAMGRLRLAGSAHILARLVGDFDPKVRAAAMAALGRCVGRLEATPSSLLDAVRRAMSDPDSAVRAGAIDVASRIGLHDQGARLFSILQEDPDARVRERAALAIGLLRIPGGEEELIAASRRAEAAPVRAAAALGAGAYDRDSLVPLVLEMPDEASVRDVLRDRLKSDPWFRLLSRKLARAREVELRALAASNGERAQAFLADGMQGILDAGERVRLIHSLQAFQGEHSRTGLLKIVRSDPSPEVRTAALAALGELMDPDEILSFASRALGDPSIMVRRGAIALFARVPAHRALPRLLQTLRTDDDPAVLAAAAALAEEEFAAFRDAAEAVTPRDRRAELIAKLSRYIHHPDLPARLLPIAQSPVPEVRKAVAELWRHRPDLADSATLESLTEDPVTSVRHAAAGAAAAARRLDLLDRMTQDPDPGVRREVAITLGREAPVPRSGLAILGRLEADADMGVRAAAYVAHLLQGVPVAFPPGLDPRVASDAVRDVADTQGLRSIARTASAEPRRLAAALILALVQDEVAREVARSDPAPEVRHRVGGALELL